MVAQGLVFERLAGKIRKTWGIPKILEGDANGGEDLGINKLFLALAFKFKLEWEQSQQARPLCFMVNPT